jgi:hypothetical protein
MRPILILALVCLSACEKKPTCAEIKPKYDAILACARENSCAITQEDAQLIHDYMGRCIPRRKP